MTPKGLGVNILTFDLHELNISMIVQYGVLGLVAYGFLKGWIVPGWLYRQKEDENKQLRDAVQDFTPLMKLALEKLNSMKVKKGVGHSDPGNQVDPQQGQE